jgi:hypothetical protein
MRSDQAAKPSEPIAERGEEIYHRLVRPCLTEADRGKVVAIDVESEDYTIGKDAVEAVPPLEARRPNARIWLRRVGFKAMHWFGNPPREPL